LSEMKELEVRHGVDGEVLRSRWRCSSAVGRDPRVAVETGEASRRWQRHPLDWSRVRTVAFVAAPVNLIP
jgi:hypothetical protein